MSIGFQSRAQNERQTPRRRQIYNGSTKTVFEGVDPGTLVLYFKDDIQDVGGNVHTIVGKGTINNRISELLLSRLAEIGIGSHFIKRLNMKEHLVHCADVIPARLTIHNIAVGSFAHRLGLQENFVPAKSIFEFQLKDRSLGYPVVSAQHLLSLELVREEEIDAILTVAQRINDYLNGQFLALGYRLVNFTLQFGRLNPSDYIDEPHLIIVDELSADNIALIDLSTGELHDPAAMAAPHAIDTYRNIASKLGILADGGPLDLQESVVQMLSTGQQGNQ